MTAVIISNRLCTLLCVVVLLSGSQLAVAQRVPADALLMPDAKIQNAQAARLGNHLYLSLSGLDADGQPQTGQVTIPRLASSLTDMRWLEHEPDNSLSLKVEQDHWILQWKSRPKDASVIVLSFDAAPLLMSEVKPARATGDGAIYLKASDANTTGEKIRYEPQTFKNTVGYWVGKQDYAEWKLDVAQPGKYNVGILQGCGAGQGGSQAKLTLAAEGKSSQLQFEVVETGHFQNFQWRHLGQLEVDSAGTYTLKLQPVEIKKNALMDVRAIHLVPLPR